MVDLAEDQIEAEPDLASPRSGYDEVCRTSTGPGK